MGHVCPFAALGCSQETEIAVPLAAVVEMHFKTGGVGWVDAVHGREWIRGKSLKVSSLCPLIRRKLTSETVR